MSTDRCLAVCILLVISNACVETEPTPVEDRRDERRTRMSPDLTGPDDPARAYPDPRGSCEIASGYPDDHACVPAPAPDEGMQIHVGPSDYDDVDEIATFVLQPGEETSACWTFHTPNEDEIVYQTYLLSGRAGTHHIINTMYDVEMPDGGFTSCADVGFGTNVDIIDNLPGASKAYMPRVPVAPENEHVGRTIPRKAVAQADMHYFNFTDAPILREFWMNIYFADRERITQRADQIRAMGGLSWSNRPIEPGTNRVYAYECPIEGDGRIVELLGHYHAHGKRFTASIRRSGESTPEKVFEMYDYKEPATFQYDSLRTNPPFSTANAGAASGVLEVSDGDTLLWECHIVNDSDRSLTYTNHVNTGEMCNLWGFSVGISPLDCLRD